jgi:hypothetical protein
MPACSHGLALYRHPTCALGTKPIPEDTIVDSKGEIGFVLQKNFALMTLIIVITLLLIDLVALIEWRRRLA